MPNVEVKCAVSNCIFHAKGNVCGAEEIEIDMDHANHNGTSNSQNVDYQSISEEASHSADTCCKTFKSKDENCK